MNQPDKHHDFELDREKEKTNVPEPMCEFCDQYEKNCICN